MIPADRISPIAQQLIAFIPLPNIDRRARPEQLRAGADAREDDRRVRRQGQLHDQRERPDVLRASASCGRSCSIPGLFGQYGGPANGGFAGTGTNTSYSTAVTWTRVFSKSTVLDVRGGLNYYRNIDDHRPATA